MTIRAMRIDPGMHRPPRLAPKHSRHRMPRLAPQNLDTRYVPRASLACCGILDTPVLHEFLSTNRAAIITRAREKVAARPAPRATEEELTSGIPLFLDQLTEVLRVSHVSSAAMADSATAHGRRLLSLGFTVARSFTTMAAFAWRLPSWPTR